MHISITGLKPKGLLGYIRFWFLAIPSFRQAQTAPGNLHADVRKMQGFQCRELMLNFLRSGVHLKAMKTFHKIATGPTYGYESETIPTWEEAFELLMEKGKYY
jgi:hypothetical protein